MDLCSIIFFKHGNTTKLKVTMALTGFPLKIINLDDAFSYLNNFFGQQLILPGKQKNNFPLKYINIKKLIKNF